ncbi:10980_t:CDS:1, partial [Gigaspora margarita]
FACFNSDENGKNWGYGYGYSSECHEKSLRDSSENFLIDELE